MASISKDPNGRKRILFVSPKDNKRKTIRLGKATVKQALAFKVKLENLISGQWTGNIEDETARWLVDLSDELYAKLATFDLVEPREANEKSKNQSGNIKQRLLGEFLEGYMKSRTDIKSSSAVVLGHTKRNLLDHFGEDKPIAEITEGDADLWRIYLKEQNLSLNTINRRCGNAKLFFRAAKKHKLIESNPFENLKSTTGGNKEREYFLSREDMQKVLNACPDRQWEVIFALARYGGIRTPSETLRLRWRDIDWETGKVLIHSPKTEHHPNGKNRMIPLFPELHAVLKRLFDEGRDGTEYVITRYRDTSANLRTHAHRIIRRAGLEPWPKTFQNLRSTRETELMDRWPAHVVCAWIGNSQRIAEKHYLQVTQEHFEQAAQNAAQYQEVTDSNELNADLEVNSEADVLQEVTSKYLLLQELSMGRAGFEPA